MLPSKLCHSLNTSSLSLLFKRLLGDPLCQAGAAGKRSSDLIGLMQSLISLAGANAVDAGKAASIVQANFKQQILAMQHDRANGEFMHFETRSSASIQKKRFDLASCSSCRLHVPKSMEKHGGKSIPSSSVERGSSTSGGQGTRPSSSSFKAKWLPEQMSPLSRGRLDVGRDSCVSNEFNSFFSLRHRFVIAAIHAEIGDPRCRYVKAIKVFFSPRPVEDPAILKSSDFSGNWQLCGSLNLTRGCSRASLALSTPVVAANLKIEYSDFYERHGSTKSSDGSSGGTLSQMYSGCYERSRCLCKLRRSCLSV